jgi:hypothetical protein
VQSGFPVIRGAFEGGADGRVCILPLYR